MIHKKQDVDNTLVISVLASIAAGLLVWNCIIVYDIQKDVKEIKTTVNDMRQSYLDYKKDLK
jgi:cell division protein FtsL